jgi:hypothetical protein
VCLYFSTFFSWRIRNLMIMLSLYVYRTRTGPYTLPKPVLHTVRSSSSSFNFHYPLLSFRPSSSCLILLPHLPVTSTLSSILPSITCCRRQLLQRIWRIQLAFLLFILCKIFLSLLTLRNTSSFCLQSVQLISILLQQRISIITGISDLSKASSFQHHTNFWSKYSIL